MAKEAGKPKVKKRAKGGKSQGRPKFCPNSSKSFNLSTTRSNSRLHASQTALKKNNEELAKNLNLAKEVIAKLQKENGTKVAENMELRMELGQLRAGPDPHDVEMEIQRRVKEHMVKVNKDIRAAMDHTIGLSGILTELCVSTNRASVTSAGSGVGMMATARSSDIGGTTRMRQVGGNSTNTWSRGSQGKAFILTTAFMLSFPKPKFKCQIIKNFGFVFTVLCPVVFTGTASDQKRFFKLRYTQLLLAILPHAHI